MFEAVKQITKDSDYRLIFREAFQEIASEIESLNSRLTETDIRTKNRLVALKSECESINKIIKEATHRSKARFDAIDSTLSKTESNSFFTIADINDRVRLLEQQLRGIPIQTTDKLHPIRTFIVKCSGNVSQISEFYNYLDNCHCVDSFEIR